MRRIKSKTYIWVEYVLGYELKLLPRDTYRVKFSLTNRFEPPYIPSFIPTQWHDRGQMLFLLNSIIVPYTINLGLMFGNLTYQVTSFFHWRYHHWYLPKHTNLFRSRIPVRVKIDQFSFAYYLPLIIWAYTYKPLHSNVRNWKTCCHHPPKRSHICRF